MTQPIADVMHLSDYGAAPNEPEKAPVPVLTLDQLREQSQAVAWMVKHVIPAVSVGFLFGGSGTFKSFIALDMALHVAHGLPWLGRKTARGTVMFIAAEGGSGLWRRIVAWHRRHQRSWADIRGSFFVVPVAVDLLEDAVRVHQAASAVGVRADLVIVDTFSQTFAGEENSAGEVAEYLRMVGRWFREAWNAAVLIVHHTGHAETERPRGSSTIRANVDFMFGVFRDETEMMATLECHKQKDGELPDPMAFAMSVVHLKDDEDGDPVTSLVASYMDGEQTLEHMAHEAQRGRGGRHQLFIDLAVNGALESKVRTAFYESMEGANMEAKKRAYSRARMWAVKNHVVEITGSPKTIIRTGLGEE